MNKTDSQLKKEIETKLRRDPDVDSAQILVSVENGDVTLLGFVDTSAQKWAAEAATRRASGIRTFAQDLTVKIVPAHKRTDKEVEAGVHRAHKRDVFTPNGVIARVQHCAVTLEAQGNWNFEREDAERTMQYLTGVTPVNKTITLKRHTSAAEIKTKI